MCISHIYTHLYLSLYRYLNRHTTLTECVLSYQSQNLLPKTVWSKHTILYICHRHYIKQITLKCRVPDREQPNNFFFWIPIVQTKQVLSILWLAYMYVCLWNGIFRSVNSKFLARRVQKYLVQPQHHPHSKLHSSVRMSLLKGLIKYINSSNAN